MINIKYGSALTAPQNILCNVVTCGGTTGNDVTRRVFNLYPVCYQHYIEACNFRSLNDLLGTAQHIKISDRKYVSNLFVGLTDKPGFTSLNITMLQKAFKEVIQFANLNAMSLSLCWKFGDETMEDDMWEDALRVITELSDMYTHLEVSVYRM